MGTIQPARFLTDAGQILPGVVRVVTQPNPAAGADFTVNVPAGVMWKIISGQATLTTSATVATRIPQIQLTSQGHDIGVYPGNETDAASITAVVTFSQCLPSVSAPGGLNNSTIALPTYPLVQGDTFGSDTVALQAGDQWSAIAFAIEEIYFTNPQLAELEREVTNYQYQAMRQMAGNASAQGSS